MSSSPELAAILAARETERRRASNADENWFWAVLLTGFALLLAPLIVDDQNGWWRVAFGLCVAGAAASAFGSLQYFYARRGDELKLSSTERRLLGLSSDATLSSGSQSTSKTKSEPKKRGNDGVSDDQKAPESLRGPYSLKGLARTPVPRGTEPVPGRILRSSTKKVVANTVSKRRSPGMIQRIVADYEATLEMGSPLSGQNDRSTGGYTGLGRTSFGSSPIHAASNSMGVFGPSAATPATYEVSSAEFVNRKKDATVVLGLGFDLSQPGKADAVDLAAAQLLKEQGLDRRLHQAADNTKRFLQSLLEDWAREYRGVVAALAQRNVDPLVLNHSRVRQPCFKVPGGRAELNVSMEDIINACNSHQASLQAFTVFIDANRASKWASRSSAGDLTGRVSLNLLDHYVNMVEIARQVAGASGSVAHAVSRLCVLADDPSLRSLSLSSASLAIAESHGQDSNDLGAGVGSQGRKRRRLDTNLTLPSDAAILVNLFCAYLDAQLPRSNRMDRPFTRRFLLEGMPPSADILKDQIMLLQWRQDPTHYKVVVRGTVWEVEPGRRNAVHAIMLLIHAIKKFKTGYIAGHNFNKFIDGILPPIAKPKEPEQSARAAAPKEKEARTSPERHVRFLE